MKLYEDDLEMFLDYLEDLAYFDSELNEEAKNGTQFVFDFLQRMSVLIDINKSIDDETKKQIKKRFERYDFW